MLLVPTIIRCCAHIVRLVCGQTDRQMDGRSGYYYNSHAIVNHSYLYSQNMQDGTRYAVRGTDKPSIYSNPPAHAPRVNNKHETITCAKWRGATRSSGAGIIT